MRKPELIETHQSAWQLAAILLSGWTSLPILATSLFVLKGNSFLGAVCTIVVGNAILWFVRLGILAMTYEKRQSTLDISRQYLGPVGGYFIAVLLLSSTLSWFVAQTTSASDTLTHLISLSGDVRINRFIQMSVLLGVISSFLCMEGISLLRRLSTFCFPLLVIAFFVIIFTLPPPNLDSEGRLSLSGLTLVLATNLGITSDLPTFFRHSVNWKTAIKALTIVQLVSLFLGICSLYCGSIFDQGFEINKTLVSTNEGSLLWVALTVFVSLSVICANVAHVYSASVGWEILAPRALIGRKEYLILGLFLTYIFIMVADLFSIELAVQITDSSLVNLSLVLILGYLISRITGKLPQKGEQWAYFFAWLLATLGNGVQHSYLSHSYSTMSASILIIVCILTFSCAKQFVKQRFY